MLASNDAACIITLSSHLWSILHIKLGLSTQLSIAKRSWVFLFAGCLANLLKSTSTSASVIPPTIIALWMKLSSISMNLLRLLASKSFFSSPAFVLADEDIYQISPLLAENFDMVLSSTLRTSLLSFSFVWNPPWVQQSVQRWGS